MRQLTYRAAAMPFVALLAVTTGSCSDSVSRSVSEPSRVSLLQSSVVGNAARSVSVNGSFPVVSTQLSSRPEISAEHAASIAALWLKRFNAAVIKPFERDRGSPIAIKSLRACGRYFYENSAYEPPSPATPEWVRRVAGAHWLIPFCAGADQQMSVSVSVYADDSFRPSASDDPDPHGVDFFAVAVPTGFGAPAAPENVTIFVAARTGRRIREIPELVSRGYGSAPQFAVWRVVLDTSVTVRGNSTGTDYTTSELYVRIVDGWSLAMFAERPSAQPNETEYLHLHPSVMLVRRDHGARNLERVTVGEQ